MAFSFRLEFGYHSFAFIISFAFNYCIKHATRGDSEIDLHYIVIIADIRKVSEWKIPITDGNV